jgi:YegS/Rv2252/BmrU family lipid kinase
MSWLVLLNRQAGSRPEQIEKVEAALAGAGVDAEVVAPAGRLEMADCVNDAWEAGRRRFVVVGGDGTLHLVANHLVGRSERATLGLLPTGSGCDFARTFGIPSQLDAAARHLLGERTYPVDAGVLEGDFGRRYFLNVGQSGVGAAAAETAGRFPRRLGSLRYIFAFAARLPGFKSVDIEVHTPNRVITAHALAVIFANAQFFAGGWNVAPRAAVTDGELDLQVISARKWEAPRLVPKIIRGLHLSDRTVRRLSVPSFELRTEHPWPVEADGEYLGNTPLRGSVLSAALDLKI